MLPSFLLDRYSTTCIIVSLSVYLVKFAPLLLFFHWWACSNLVFLSLSSVYIAKYALFKIFRRLFLHRRVPVIFNGVIGPAPQIFGHFRPFVTHDPMTEKEYPFLRVSPFLLIDIWIQVIVPSFPTLFADATCVNLSRPGRCSAIVVHFWAPYLWTNLMRYSSYPLVHDFFFPMYKHPYIWSFPQACRRNLRRYFGEIYAWVFTIFISWASK